MVFPSGSPRARRALILTGLLSLSCASQKTKEDLAEDRSTEAERLLFSAKASLDRLEPDDAEEKLKRARRVLQDPAAAHWPDHDFQMQDLATKEERLGTVRAEVARIALEKAVKAQTEALEAVAVKLDLALKPLRAQDAAAYTASQIDDAGEARSSVIDRLKEGAELESRSPPYQTLAKSVAEQVKQVPDVLQRAQRAVSFAEGPLRASQHARVLVEEAKSEADPAEKVARLIEAKGELDRCATSAGEAAREPALAKVRFEDGGRATTPKTLIQSCRKRSKALKRQITALRKRLDKKKARPKKKRK